MALHMIKLCVGAENVDDLADWQAGRIAERRKAKLSPNAFHDTRMRPKRADEMLAGGSLYWVIKNRIAVRQKLLRFETLADDAGKAMCRIHLDPELVRVNAREKRPFQGWRYLHPKDAPADLIGKGPALSADLEMALKAALAW
jgi:hypothetical protein